LTICKLKIVKTANFNRKMAVIGRIRKRVGLLIAFVGISMILFILGDLVTSNTGLMSQNSDVIGEVGSNKIHYAEFEKRVEVMIENYKVNSQQESLDQGTQDMLREQAWNQVITELTLGKEYQKLGLSCSAEELYDMCTGKNVHPQIRQAFTNKETGAFNPQDVVRFLKELPDRPEDIQKQWKSFEDAIREERIAEKYKSLIKGGLFATTEEAKRNADEQGRTAAVRAVKLGYETIADSVVTVDDHALREYYVEHKNEFKQPETMRKIEYVAIDIVPSDEDRNQALEWITKKKEEFATAPDAIAYVDANSDTPADTIFRGKGSMLMALDTVMPEAPENTIIGPYLDGNSYKVARLAKSRMIADSIKVSHALVAYKGAERAPETVTRTRDEAKVRADSLFTLADNDKKFIEIASTASDDAVSSTKQGDLGWITASTGFDLKFKEAAFATEKGKVTLVETNFGFHIIKVFDASKKEKQVQVAVLERKIEPSQKTYDALYNKAQAFAAENSTGASFDTAAMKKGLSKRVADNIREADKIISGLDQPRELVRWAYKANKDEVSKVFTLGDKYVIARLVSIREKGIPPMEEVKERVISGARKEKKAEMLIEKFKTQASGLTTIDAIGNKVGAPPITVDKISFASNYIESIGNEPGMLGVIFSMKQGQLSHPIKGENGVYVVSVDRINEPPATTDFSASQKQVSDNRKQRSEYEVLNALKEKAGVEDHRGKFY
jgi:peptidyl-prolyl cis-trans isomerase D